jgi:hypothetical protein
MKLHQLVFFRSPMAGSVVMQVTKTDDACKLPGRIPRAACRLLLWG